MKQIPFLSPSAHSHYTFLIHTIIKTPIRRLLTKRGKNIFIYNGCIVNHLYIIRFFYWCKKITPFHNQKAAVMPPGQYRSWTKIVFAVKKVICVRKSRQNMTLTGIFCQYQNQNKPTREYSNNKHYKFLQIISYINSAINQYRNIFIKSISFLLTLSVIENENLCRLIENYNPYFFLTSLPTLICFLTYCYPLPNYLLTVSPYNLYKQAYFLTLPLAIPDPDKLHQLRYCPPIK